MRMTAFQEKYFKTDHLQLNYAEGPSAGPPLVVLHGGTVHWRFMMPVLPLLARRWHVYAVDMRGHGLSGRSPGHYHLTDFAGDLVAFAQQKIQEPAVFLGFSWGGLVALHAAGQVPARALILESPPLDLHRRKLHESPVRDYFERVRQAIRTVESQEALIDLLQANGLARDSGAAREWAQAFSRLDPRYVDSLLDGSALSGLDFKQILQAVASPTLLLLAGARKRTLSEEDIRFARENIQHLHVVEIEEAENAIHHSHPQQMAAQVDQFFSSING